MLKQFQNHINNKLPFLIESKLLIAISGGLDSVVLTCLCKELGLDIALAHCNFKLRGMESDNDENFVMDLGDQLDLEVFVQYFDTKMYAETEKISIQMAARELRYDWFNGLAQNLNFDYILTAHHADDNLETFLINLSRGSGLSGLTGIPELNDNIVRPLLPFSRSQLEAYANDNQIKWQEDSSNATDNYLRNKLRHHIIPQLKDIAPELLSSFNKTISNLNDTADIVDESLNAVAKRAIVDIDERQIRFKISEFEKVNNSKAYLFEMFKEYGFTEWDDVVNLLKAQTGKQVFSKTHRLLKDRKHLILTSIDYSEGGTTEEPIFSINDNDKVIEMPSAALSFEDVSSYDKNSKTSIYLDKDKLNYPLQCRKWKKGDVFCPIGMRGKKKLSKYFKDEKLSLVDKENTWLLTSNEEIVWVAGMRADDRFKATDGTKHILKVSFNRK